MTRKRFEELVNCLSFSGTLPSAEGDKWEDVQGFVDAINDHRQSYVHPSETICVDESISRWYGLGGDWIDIGVPNYVALDRKPESGCELKSACCGDTGILLRLEISKSAADTAELVHEQSEQHGTATVLRLIEP